MKVAIIGSHSTGKTTLIRELKNAFEEQGKEVLVLEELARLCPLPINEETTMDAQKWILLNQIAQENTIDHTGKVLITDRSTIDNFAYMYRIGMNLGAEHFEHHAVLHMSSYDYIFKTKLLDISAKEDGVRTADGPFRDMMDRLINLLLAKHAVPFHLLPDTLDYSTHVQFIMDTLQIQNRENENHILMPVSTQIQSQEVNLS